MGTRLIRVLVVDDYEPWRRFFSTTLRKRPELQIVKEAIDGVEAVEQAEQLRPDLILLDIGLSKLNGIEAARQIRGISPASKILFISESRSRDIVEQALCAGAEGYVVKSDAARELLPAIEAVLEGKRFVSASLRDQNSNPTGRESGKRHSDIVASSAPSSNVDTLCPHAVGFYSDDQRFLEDLTQFVGNALKAGNAAIVVATDSHRASLVARLPAYGVDLDTAIHQGRYIALGAVETLSEFMVNNLPDPARFLKLLGDLIVAATEAAKGEHPCVSIFGECVNLLWEQGNPDAAIQMEKLGNHLANIHNVRILCGYSLRSSQGRMDDHFFQQICAEHSAVYSQ